MNFSVVQQGVAQFCLSAYETSATVAIWFGKHVSIGVTTYIIPTIQAIWAAIIPCLIQTKNIVLAGHCPPLLIAGVLFVVSITAFKFVKRKAYEEGELPAKIWNTVGALALIGATVFTSFGISGFFFLTPV